MSECRKRLRDDVYLRLVEQERGCRVLLRWAGDMIAWQEANKQPPPWTVLHPV